jgi:hypothetical protein
MKNIKTLILHIPWPPLLIITLLLGLAPFSPMPHLIEKTTMIFDGSLKKPIDIFDLIFHVTPSVLVIIKLLLGKENER